MSDLISWGRVDPRRLAEARLFAHRAVQWLSRAARAVLPAAPDDSHSNLGWERDLGALTAHDTGPGRIGLRIADLTLLRIESNRERGTFRLDGKTEVDARAWIDQQLTSFGFTGSAGDVALPYALPDPGVKPYEASPHAAALAELAGWFDVANSALHDLKNEYAAIHPGPSDVRCWPHHFDIATLVSLEEGDPETARAVGVGLSPGDESFDQPYLYVTPYPPPQGETPPVLPAPGRWQTEGFVGAIALGEDLIGLADPREGMLTFLQEAFEAVRPV